LLDVGCGNGNDLAIFCEMGAKAHGIDSSQESVTIARKKCPKATIVVGSGDKLPYPNATFGVVASKYAAQAMLNVPELLQEVARVLKPGGYFILLTKHPLRQFLEKIDTYRDTGTPINYFEQQIVTSSIFEGKIQLREPSHTLLEYLSLAVLQKFDLVDFVEDCDAPASDQLFGLKYATFFVAKFRRR
jgi:ubiquinone/menaquinone biosynthesis C-methylase UbiE